VETVTLIRKTRREKKKLAERVSQGGCRGEFPCGKKGRVEGRKKSDHWIRWWTWREIKGDARRGGDVTVVWEFFGRKEGIDQVRREKV